MNSLTGVRVRVMVFNASFNNNTVESWWSVLMSFMVEETGENNDLSQVTVKL